MSYEPDEIVEILKADPFGELARKERKALLLMSVAAIAISKAGLVPTKISAFGIEVSQTNRSAILWLSVAIVFYFLVTFLTYALPDFFSWQIRHNKFWYKVSNEQTRIEEEYGPQWDEPLPPGTPEPSGDHKRILKTYGQSRVRFQKLTYTKIALDLAVPVLVSIVAIFFAATAAWCQAGAKTP